MDSLSSSLLKADNVADNEEFWRENDKSERSCESSLILVELSSFPESLTSWSASREVVEGSEEEDSERPESGELLRPPPPHLETKILNLILLLASLEVGINFVTLCQCVQLKFSL